MKSIDQPHSVASLMPAARIDVSTVSRNERQAEGIAKAKAAGKYLGRKPSIDAGKVRKMKSEGLGVTAIAREMGISRVSVYRVLKAA